ncbi:hypothetical protein ATANTOWER_013902 [Ataeniobius toweri]|uniref:Uncharacterized protein n=1 Tax=Ataeniobius toweri TaxID=208326 RepID=A0ABU7BGK4_9TELE|nr:hypothetical protein [Ataeniobius toweri]
MTKMFPKIPEKTKSPYKIASAVRISDMASSSAWHHELAFLCDKYGAEEYFEALLLTVMVFYMCSYRQMIKFIAHELISADHDPGRFNPIHQHVPCFHHRPTLDLLSNCKINKHIAFPHINHCME